MNRPPAVAPRPALVVYLIGGPTAILEIGGLRLMTDPTFDPPREYMSGSGNVLTKIRGPAVSPDGIDHIDVVLLSHDQHVDNLDHLGREFLKRVPRVLTTTSAAGRLGPSVTALPNFEHVDLNRPDGGMLTVTGLPAQHGPANIVHLTGEVTGFLLAGDGLPTVYISGDNASLDVVTEIVRRIPAVDVAVLFAGGAQAPRFGDAYLTLSGPLAAQAAKLLNAAHVVPLHIDGWKHFTDGAEELALAFAEVGLAERLVVVEPGGVVR